jgi:hypothetical protein
MKQTSIVMRLPEGFDEALVRIVAPDGTLIPADWVVVDFRSTLAPVPVWTPADFWPGSTEMRHE